MRQFFSTAFVIFLASLSVAHASELNGVCLGTKQLHGFANSTKILGEFTSKDKYRFEDGNVYHRNEEKDEYLYNKVVVSPFNPSQFLSGHMRFVLNDKQSGYVVVADNISWKIVYLECAFK